VTVLIFLALISALVFVHELGHFWVARRSGVRVDEFGIGFPPRLASWKRGGVVYSLNLLPLGGFVRIHGENGEGTGDPDSFGAKRARTRAAILGAGVAMNWLVAFLAMAVALSIGVEASPGSTVGRWVSEVRPTVISVEVGSPAAAAGIAPGATILSAAQGDRAAAIARADEFTAFTAASATTAPITVRFVPAGESEAREVPVTPAWREELGRPAVGVSVIDSGMARLPVLSAIAESARYTVELTGTVAASLWNLAADAVRRDADIGALSGPVGIAVLAREASDVGFGQLLAFAAAISVNLAVLNLLPFPALDGDDDQAAAVEKATRRKLPERWLGWVNLVGLGLLLALMAAVTVSDIVKLF
jgi:regulator of sigma E protease